MGHVSRHEVSQLIQQFKDRVIPKELPLGMPGIAYMGINSVEHEFQRAEGSPSVKLRCYARVLKHYIDLPKDPKNLALANAALHLVSQGFDSTTAIKKARKHVEEQRDPQKMADEANRVMKRLVESEQTVAA